MSRRGRSNRPFILVAGIALGGSSSCVSEAVEQQVAPVLVRRGLRADAVGCWALVDSVGRSASGAIAWAPAIARLDPADHRPAHAELPHRRVARRFDRAWQPLPLGVEPGGIDGAMTWWADSLTDSVRIEFNNAFYGSAFVLAVPQGRRVDTLRGRAYEFSDVVPDRSPHFGAVAAIRVQCRMR